MKLKKVKVLEGFDGGCSLGVSRSGKVMVACDVTCRVWDTRTWKVRGETDEVDEAGKSIQVFDLSPDGDFLAVGDLHLTTKVFDTRTGKRVAQLSKPKKDTHTSANHLAFSPDGSEVASVTHSKLQVFRAGDWHSAREYPLHPPQISAMGYTPDGKSLVTASGKSVVFWNTTDAKKKLELTGHKKLVHSFAIAVDGTFIATPSEDEVVMLWKLPSGKKYAEYTGHEDKVFRVVLSPDGKTAASFDYNDEFHLWDTKTQQQVAKVQGGDYEKMAFSPDGRWLVIPDFQESLRVVDARDGQVVAEIEAGYGMAFVGGRMAVSQGSKVVLWEFGK